jgi:hypothetical protein
MIISYANSNKEYFYDSMRIIFLLRYWVVKRIKRNCILPGGRIWIVARTVAQNCPCMLNFAGNVAVSSALRAQSRTTRAAIQTRTKLPKNSQQQSANHPIQR